MTIMKGLAIIALLVGGTSLALAQGPPTGGYPSVSGGAAGNPATNPVTSGPPGPGVIPHDVTANPNPRSAAAPTRASSRTRVAHQPTKHRLYMTNRTHKGSKM
jgi:hypothetical protein